MGPRGVPWPSRGVPWPLYEDHMLEPAIMIYWRWTSAVVTVLKLFSDGPPYGLVAKAVVDAVTFDAH